MKRGNLRGGAVRWRTKRLSWACISLATNLEYATKMWLCTESSPSWPRYISSQPNWSLAGRMKEGWKALRKRPWARGKEGWGKTFSSLNVNQLPKATEAPRGGDRNNYMINGNVLIQVSGIQHSGIQRRPPYCSLTRATASPRLGTNNYAPPPPTKPTHSSVCK